MNNYIKEIENCCLNNIDGVILSKFLCVLTESKDPIMNLLNRYTNSTVSFSLTDGEYLILLEELKDTKYTFTKIFLYFLLSFSSRCDKCDFKECFKLYFSETVSQITQNHTTHTANIILPLARLIKIFPSCKKEIKKHLYNTIIELKESNLIILFLVYKIQEHEFLKNFFSSSQLIKMSEKHLAFESDEKTLFFHIDLYESLLEYLKNSDKTKKDQFVKDLCWLVIKNISFIKKDRFNQLLLQKIRKYMSKDKFKFDFKDEDFCLVDEAIETMGQETLSKMIKIQINTDEEYDKLVSKQIEINDSLFNKFSNIDKLIETIASIKFLDLEFLQTHVQQNHKNSLNKIIPTYFYDEEGYILNDSVLDSGEKFSLSIIYDAKWWIDLQFLLLLNMFFETYKTDKESEEFISDIINSSSMVGKKWKINVTNTFINFFNGLFDSSVITIILNLENNLRVYFKNKGLNIRKNNKTLDYIGLGEIFNLKEDNKYRDVLFKKIDENFYFTLEWLLTDRFGVALRNKISHGTKVFEASQLKEGIYCCCLIFILYMTFND